MSSWWKEEEQRREKAAAQEAAAREAAELLWRREEGLDAAEALIVKRLLAAAQGSTTASVDINQQLEALERIDTLRGKTRHRRSPEACRCPACLSVLAVRPLDGGRRAI